MENKKTDNNYQSLSLLLCTVVLIVCLFIQQSEMEALKQSHYKLKSEYNELLVKYIITLEKQK